MSLEVIYYAAQTAAALVIVATLFAVFLQMRQANMLAKLGTSRAIWTDAAARLMAQVEDSEKAEFMQRALFGTGELTDAEKTRFFLLMSSMFVMFEGAFAMTRSGMLEDRLWPRMRASMRGYVASERAQRWWAIARKRAFGANPEFCAAVDEVLAEVNGRSEAYSSVS